MRGIGGNTVMTLQVATWEKNAIGERVATWGDKQTLTGWLDLSGGSSGYTAYAAKVQESTHLFIADYVPLDAAIRAENARAVIDGAVYDVMLLDNPMGMREGSQWEIYLKYTGGQQHGGTV